MADMSKTQSDECMIKVSGVWKIFGAEANAALAAVKNEGLGKAEILEQYNAVVGVADVNLEINRGEIFCIMGLSGSGKSTLVRHFNRLLEPTAGSIEIEGTDVMGLPPDELMAFRNKKIGMVFQHFALMPHRSVLDNVAMPLEIRHVSKNDRLAQASKILEIVELSAWGNKFAHELSGGMQQRVGLARALAADPRRILRVVLQNSGIGDHRCQPQRHGAIPGQVRPGGRIVEPLESRLGCRQRLLDPQQSRGQFLDAGLNSNDIGMLGRHLRQRLENLVELAAGPADLVQAGMHVVER